MPKFNETVEKIETACGAVIVTRTAVVGSTGRIYGHMATSLIEYRPTSEFSGVVGPDVLVEGRFFNTGGARNDGVRAIYFRPQKMRLADGTERDSVFRADHPNRPGLVELVAIADAAVERAKAEEAATIAAIAEEAKAAGKAIEVDRWVEDRDRYESSQDVRQVFVRPDGTIRRTASACY